MKKCVLLSIVAVAISIFPLAPFAFSATQTFEITKNSLLDKTAFSLSFSLCGARVTIRRINDDNTIVKADVTYKTTQWEQLEPKLATESSGNTFIAKFRSGLRALPYTNANIEEWDIAIGNYDVATDLNITCSSVSAAINLGGLPLTQCTLTLRQGTAEIDFDAPTTRPVEQFRVNGHAMNLSITNIGNTDFASFDLTGLGGTADLDFEGFYEAQEHNAQIITTAMIFNITVPFDAGEQVGVLPLSLPIVVVPRSEWNRDLWLPFFQRHSTNDYNTQNIKINLGITSIGSFGMVVRD